MSVDADELHRSITSLPERVVSQVGESSGVGQRIYHVDTGQAEATAAIGASRDYGRCSGGDAVYGFPCKVVLYRRRGHCHMEFLD